MAYQALLFCPDEKTARTVTQVLSELEFSVEAFSEPFAAVKKLMAEHYDAVVVDCENEQNGTLLFKSARNSTSNQTSLAVAVVEGQAGVAKAFRIGANLVLTKPINVEQAKGTLRVARGLLRKGDPAKPAAPVSTPAPAKPANVTATPKPAPPVARTLPPRPLTPSSTVKPAAPVSRPVQPVIAAQAPPAAPVMPSEINVDDILETPSAAAASTAPVPKPVTREVILGTPAKPMPPAAPVSSSTGAASAPAPARIVQQPVVQEPAPAIAALDVEHSIELDKPAEVHTPGPAPTFTFGGANAPQESASSGSKKAIIGVAAALAVAAGLYFGWTQFHGKSTATGSQPSAGLNSPAPQLEQPSKPATASQSPVSGVPSASAPVSSSVAENTDREPVQDIRLGPDKSESSAKAPVKSAPTTAGTKSSAERPSPEPIMVKNGNTTPGQAPVVTDAPAPSMLGMAPSASNAALPNLGVTNAPKPVLQNLNVSQGVSQGLLIKKVAPNYPSAALRMHVEGAVQLSATITKTGNISAVTIVSGEPMLSKAAVDAVKQWKYKPYYLNGEPVEIQTQITVNFKLPR